MDSEASSKMPSKEYHGGCHCGAVQFKCVAPEKLLVLDCNCSICYMKQNFHFIINKSNFTLLKGEDNLTVYQFNTMKAKHIFCKTCGIQSFYIPRSNPDSYGINPRCVKSLDLNSVTIETFDGINWEESFVKKQPKSTCFEK